MANIRPNLLCWCREMLVPQNNGAVVQTVALWSRTESRVWWHCVTTGPLVLDFPRGNHLVGPGHNVLIQQKNLVPINDPDLPLASEPSEKLAIQELHK